MKPDTDNIGARIKVVGVGGGGCNIVRRMLPKPTPGVKYILCDNHFRSPEVSSAAVVMLQMGGRYLTLGFYDGRDPNIGRREAEDKQFLAELRKVVKDADLVLIIATLGGGTGSGGAPIIARVAKETGALVLAFVTTPFSFEGKGCSRVAQDGIKHLRSEVDNMVVVHQDRVLKCFDTSAIPIGQVFTMADEVVGEGILSITQPINVPGLINVDLADVKEVMLIPGAAVMGIGKGGNSRHPPEEAVKGAIASPLLDMDIKGAKGVLLNFCSGTDGCLVEYRDAIEFIERAVNSRAKIIFGISYPEEELGNTVKLVLIATGL